jgi:hypothetical protein
VFVSRCTLFFAGVIALMLGSTLFFASFGTFVVFGFVIGAFAAMSIGGHSKSC